MCVLVKRAVSQAASLVAAVAAAAASSAGLPQLQQPQQERIMAHQSILVTLFVIFVVLPVVGLLALVYIPKPAPDRWEVRLFLLMGMPANQFLSFMVQVSDDDDA